MLFRSLESNSTVPPKNHAQLAPEISVSGSDVILPSDPGTPIVPENFSKLLCLITDLV